MTASWYELQLKLEANSDQCKYFMVYQKHKDGVKPPINLIGLCTAIIFDLYE